MLFHHAPGQCLVALPEKLLTVLTLAENTHSEADKRNIKPVQDTMT
jgi:hypothetical protein